MSDLKYKFSSSAKWSIIDNFAQQFISFVVFLILAKLINPEDFGVIAIAHVLVTFVRQVILDPISFSVVRSVELNDQLVSRAFTSNLITAFAVSSFMALLLSPVAIDYGNHDLGNVFLGMAIVVIIYGLSSTFEAVLHQQFAFKPLAIRSIASVTLGGALSIYMAFHGAGVMALVAQQIAISSIGLALLVLQSDWRPKIKIENLNYWGFYRNGRKLALSNLFNFALTQGDVLIVSIFMSSYYVGIYNFAKRLTSAIYLIISSSIHKIAIPSFSKVCSNTISFRNEYLHIVGILTFLLLPLYFGMGTLSFYLIPSFFGEKWSSAASVIPLISGMYFVLSLNQINDFVLMSAEHNSFATQRGFLQIFLSILFAWIFVDFGLTGLSLGFLLSAAALWPFSQKIVGNFLDVRFIQYFRTLDIPLIASLFMSFWLWGLQTLLPQSIYSCFVFIPTGILVFFAAYFVLIRLLPSSYKALDRFRGIKKD